MKKVAINIKTGKWNEIIGTLVKQGWIITAKYCGFDAGIDDDFIVLKKGWKKITFAWSNWFGGEIKCNDKLFRLLEAKFNTKFEFGKPHNLKPLVALTFRVQSPPLSVVKKLNMFTDEELYIFKDD